MNESYESPKEAAVASFPSASRPRVVKVVELEAEADAALVHVETEPSHPMVVRVYRDHQGRWSFAGDV